MYTHKLYSVVFSKWLPNQIFQTVKNDILFVVFQDIMLT